MKVVIDTNVILGGKKRLLLRPEFALLVNFLKTQSSTLVVPRIAFLEAVNKFREETEERINKVRSSIESLDKHLLTPSGSQPSSVTVDQAVDQYRNALEERLTQLAAEQPDHADIPHADLVTRDLARRKPFRAGGKAQGRGYRDALMWETVIRKVAEKDVETVLITNDVTDFSDATKPVLHRDLKKDLTDRGLSEDAVILVISLEAFNSEYVKPLLPEVLDIPSAIEKGKYPLFSVEAFFNDKFEEIRQQVSDAIDNQGEEFRYALPYMPSEMSSLSVDGMGEPEGICVTEGYKIDQGDIYVQINLRLMDNEIGFFITKSEAWMLHDRSPVSINEEDWNEGVSWACVYASLDVTLDVILNPTDGAVRSWEVSEATFVEEWPDEELDEEQA